MNKTLLGGGAMMHRILLVTTGVILSSSFALAAPVVSTWTGCYIGANAGGAWAHTSGNADGYYNGFGVSFIAAPHSIGSQTADGWAYGGQFGCDYQFNNNWVVGIRGMWDGANLKGSNQFPVFWTGPDNANNVKIDSFGTAVVKLGYLVNPTLQLYGLGGVAWVKDHYFYTSSNFSGDIFTGDQTRTGYDVGIGLSWMFARNWDLWIEYDHMGFGTKTANLTNTSNFPPAGLFIDPVSFKQSVDKVLVGINYRFNLGMVQ
jgi:outer membrane immunogenic protein